MGITASNIGDSILCLYQTGSIEGTMDCWPIQIVLTLLLFCLWLKGFDHSIRQQCFQQSALMPGRSAGAIVTCESYLFWELLTSPIPPSESCLRLIDGVLAIQVPVPSLFS